MTQEKSRGYIAMPRSIFGDASFAHEEAAVRANTAAGMANTAVTAAQRIEIEKKSAALAQAAVAAEKERIASSSGSTQRQPC
jgi:hypothetical protein